MRFTSLAVPGVGGRGMQHEAHGIEPLARFLQFDFQMTVHGALWQCP